MTTTNSTETTPNTTETGAEITGIPSGDTFPTEGAATVAQDTATEGASAPKAPAARTEVTLPPSRTRVVALSVVIALVIAGLGIGFAIGCLVTAS
jgi:hypothetical protein